MKSAVTNFEDAAKISLSVDSAKWGVNSNLSSKEGILAQAPTQMEIGNMEYNKTGQPKGIVRRFEEQHLLNYKRNAFYTCHKFGCRPWKHRDPAVNNFKVSDGEVQKEPKEHVYDSEN